MLVRLREHLREAQDVASLKRELAVLLPDAAERNALLRGFRRVSKSIPCPHNLSHVLTFVVAVLRLPPDSPGIIVEAGCYKGGSTAKLSLLARSVGRELVVFDSFRGLPENDEPHRVTIDGRSIEGWFRPGAFRGNLDEVRRNVAAHGDISVCRFVPGWFEDTMPDFDEDVAAAYLDVDLAASTRTCIRWLYPRLAPGGTIVSQDGDFPLVVEALADDALWEDEVGYARPPIDGLGTRKMVTIARPEPG